LTKLVGNYRRTSLFYRISAVHMATATLTMISIPAATELSPAAVLLAAALSYCLAVIVVSILSVFQL
jgi:hypothetical protein